MLFVGTTLLLTRLPGRAGDGYSDTIEALADLLDDRILAAAGRGRDDDKIRSLGFHAYVTPFVSLIAHDLRTDIAGKPHLRCPSVPYSSHAGPA